MNIPQAALRYATLDWHLLPLHPKDKRPRIGEWQNNATADAQAINQWFTQWPDSNLGLLLGQRSGVVDIEADDAEGEATANELLAGCQTPTWDSARGTHRLFTFPAGLPTDLSVTKVRGLEIRLGTNGKGAQSVLPPSIHPSGKVLQWRPGLSPFDVAPQPFPESIRQLLLTPQPSDDGMVFTCSSATPTPAIERARLYVAQMPPAIAGQRGHDATFTVACRLVEGFGLCESDALAVLAEYNERCQPPWTEQELQHKVAEAIKVASAEKLGYLNSPQHEPTTTIPAQAAAVQPELYTFQPFPFLPEPLSTFTTAAAESIGCDESFVALPVLAACASLIGNARRFQVKESWQEPALLWLGQLGFAGDKKTPAQAAATAPIVKAQESLIEENKRARQRHEASELEYEKAKAEFKKSRSQGVPPLRAEPPPERRLWCDDCTIESLGRVLRDNPRGLLLRKDELSSWLKSFCEYKSKGGDLQRWLSIYNCQPVVIDRISRESLYLPTPSCSICGGIQPGILKPFFSGETVDSGLLQRFVFAWPPVKPAKLSRHGISKAASSDYAAVLNGLRQLPYGGKSEVMRLDDAAWELFASWHDFAETEKAECCSLLKGVISKLTATAVRLAGILHCGRQIAGDVSQELVVDYQSMQLGVALARWFWDEWQRVYALQQETAEQQDNRQLVAYINAKHGGSITPHELQRHKRAIANSAAAEAQLQRLVAAGWATMQPVAPTAEGGRPTVQFVITAQ